MAAIFDALKSLVKAKLSLNSIYFWLHYFINTLVLLIGGVSVLAVYHQDHSLAFTCAAEPDINQDTLGESGVIFYHCRVILS